MINILYNFKKIVSVMQKSIGLTIAFYILPLAFAEKKAPEIVFDDSPLQVESNGQLVSYADTLEKAIPAVVSVNTKKIQQQYRRGSREDTDFLRQLFGLPPLRPLNREEPEERIVPLGMGSGVVISADGYILTNNHVITDGRGDLVDEITVEFSNGATFDAEIIGRDTNTDVAVLKIENDSEPFDFITLANSDLSRVGDIVFAIGNPLGLGHTVSSGIISALGRSDLGILGSGSENFIQVDAAINRGNSGGALIDAKGRLIGLNTAIFSRTGDNIGIGFSIPINLARKVMEQLVTKGTFSRGFLGVKHDNLDKDLAEYYGLKNTQGALITTVIPNSAASEAKLKSGDIVTEVNAIKVKSASQFTIAIGQQAPGSKVTLTILRDGKTLSKTVVLRSRDEEIAQNNLGIWKSKKLEGVSFSKLNDELIDTYNLPDDKDGVVITQIDRKSPFREKLSVGMLIHKVNNNRIINSEDIDETLIRGVNALYVYFQKNNSFVAVRVN